MILMPETVNSIPDNTRLSREISDAIPPGEFSGHMYNAIVVQWMQDQHKRENSINQRLR
jgi:hypothetical protein